MYTLDQIYDQAVNDNKPITTTMPFGASIIKMGIKIQKFKDRIEILNLSKGGSYYKLCDDKEYDIFKKNGWKIGCLQVAIQNCLHKLSLIDNKIRTEVNTRKNDKHIKNLKNKREMVLHKYSEHKIRLKMIIN
tara:strand:+ start:1521 stop:1919 length:399 start_codon:yes stop_codon:yes gene_type:complete